MAKRKKKTDLKVVPSDQVLAETDGGQRVYVGRLTNGLVLIGSGRLLPRLEPAADWR